ncbi:hypothetical protein [Vibrio europaeus]|uniref:Uncharacterized protein n=1 Tax=Vibrio europaeus TaxID=300876 RepID=A0ABT5H0I3_9VIBR|nr:hypothetical protein [Vibrio europaeus]MDC5727108.1 hypothetical protein [Vibrio europaeus]MDC5730115.1 hypothetical protein [Vibrio europaeus]MDC5735142.1 hypothetical protein [Vibrio europaeus]MDC5743034.1 hypothetical protein [Vibrio europaeus]MDC5748012.1 hypothetical protein [Vibrio europaeus]
MNMSFVISLFVKLIKVQLESQAREIQEKIDAGQPATREFLEEEIFGEDDKVDILIRELNDELNIILDINDVYEAREIQHDLITSLLD